MEPEDRHLNQKVVEDLFRQYYRVLRAYACRLVNNLSVAEDIVQDVYYELWKHSGTLEFGHHIKYYLFKSVYTKSMNHLNSKANTLRGHLEQFVDAKIQHIYIQTQLSEQESDLYTEELAGMIDRTIAAMPAQCRKIFTLSRKHEMKNREIAEQLGISVKAVEKQISKALSMLHSALNGAVVSLLSIFFQF